MFDLLEFEIRRRYESLRAEAGGTKSDEECLRQAQESVKSVFTVSDLRLMLADHPESWLIRVVRGRIKVACPPLYLSRKEEKILSEILEAPTRQKGRVRKRSTNQRKKKTK